MGRKFARRPFRKYRRKISEPPVSRLRYMTTTTILALVSLSLGLIFAIVLAVRLPTDQLSRLVELAIEQGLRRLGQGKRRD